MKIFQEAPICEKCQTPKQLRPAAPQPFWITLIFSVSFLAMLAIDHYYRLPPPVLWAWSGVQFILGMAVIRGRNRAKKTIYRCLRCETLLT